MVSELPDPAKWKIRVRLVVTDFPGTFDELTRRIGIRPDRTLEAGKPVAPGRARASDRWIIDATADDRMPLQDQLELLLDRVSSVADRLSDLPEPTSVIVSCGVQDYDRDVSLNFEADVVARVAKLKATLDIGYYDMSSEK